MLKEFEKWVEEYKAQHRLLNNDINAIERVREMIEESEDELRLL